MVIIENTDVTLKFSITDSENNVVILKPEFDITLKIKRREEDYTVTTQDFPCIVDLEDNTAMTTLPKSYLTENTTHQFQLIIKTPQGSVYSSHIDSFFVCDGI